MKRLASILAFLFLTAPAFGQDKAADEVRFFETNVRPVLAIRCYSCHGPEAQKSKLRVDSLEALLRGGRSGPALKAGAPEESLLILAIRHSDSLQMPPKMKLPAKEIADLSAWVKMGAPWPDAKPVLVKGDVKEVEPVFTKEQTSHWAFQPVRKPEAPAVKKKAWVYSPIDAFILAKLEEKGLTPAPPAEARSLIRRVYFDLIGLPPTPEDVDRFLMEATGGNRQIALEKLVERLLSSPRYGERWARHWLDVVRYADSNGMDENLVFGNAWRYRDYVIQAFNNDMPYDRFVREQIAGDLLKEESAAKGNDQLIATGFLCIGPKMLAEDDPVKMEMDIIDEQLDTTGRAFLGMTFGCVRCHDHKYDPFTIADYYGLAGIFKSTKTMDHFRVVARWQERPIGSLADQEKAREHAQSLADLKGRIDQIVQRHYQETAAPARKRAREYLDTALRIKSRGLEPHSLFAKATEAKQPGLIVIEEWAKEKGLDREFLKQWLDFVRENPTPKDEAELEKISLDAKGPFRLTPALEAGFPALVLKELREKRDQLKKLEKSVPEVPEAMAAGDGKATDLRIHLRGNHLTLGKEAPRRFPRFFSALKHQPIEGAQSGRRQLAHWLTQPEHPLTSRVMVNRLWHWHFGSGLVRSVDNFGLLGDKPSHPDLLDFLAAQFVESGWSMKAMHRAIVLSNTYQMSSAYDEAAFQNDPDNRLHWRHTRRRLEAEALRDSLFLLADNLDITPAGSLFEAKNRAYVPGYPNGNYDKYDIPRRSVYLPVIRSALYDVLQAFDFADPSFPSGERATTTVAPQALFLMNGKIVHEQTRLWVMKLLADKCLDDAGRVRRIYLQALGRPPSEKELARALDFVERIESELARRKTADSRPQAWQSFCRVIVSANEFVYVE